MRAFRIAYDGTGFSGFQRQPSVSTVEESLFDALRSLDIMTADMSTPRAYTAAGRTDAGVSALAQTIAFDAPEWLTPAAFNSTLPDTVRAWAHTSVSPDFHARFDATEREYAYFHFAPTEKFDYALATRVADGLSGTHDFANLTPDDSATERTVSITLHREGDIVIVRCIAPGFSRQLVRRLVTVIDRIASGEREYPFIDRVLDPSPLPGEKGVGPAPAEPLLLASVTYPDIAFEYESSTPETISEYFHQQRIESTIRTRLMNSIEDKLARK